LEEDRAGPDSSQGLLTAEIAAGEPLVQGGHTAGGYWVDVERRSTVEGLWAVGDVAGGCPQKYVTGALAEGAIAAESVARAIKSGALAPPRPQAHAEPWRRALSEILRLLNQPQGRHAAQSLSLALRRTMDLYAGGATVGYAYSQSKLTEAEKRLRRLAEMALNLSGQTSRQFAAAWQLRERIVVAQALCAHLKARKETRWPGFGEHIDYPERDDSIGFINSKLTPNGYEIIERPLLLSLKGGVP
jgi:adenylylsulfate reductase subunit A